MKKIVLLVGISCGTGYFNPLKAQTPVLAAFSIEEKQASEEIIPAENGPKAELAAYGKSPVLQTNEQEKKEGVPVLAASGQEPPKK